ncbi:MAG: integrase core domain-containing protein [Bacteroidetes bacterium]|nr:integrase core domain-containing protein [Bacteroidota bacterium]
MRGRGSAAAADRPVAGAARAVERLWKSVNRVTGRYEYLYLQRPESCQELYQGLKQYFLFYNQERLHQSLDYKTPESIYNMAA